MFNWFKKKQRYFIGVDIDTKARTDLYGIGLIGYYNKKDNALFVAKEKQVYKDMAEEIIHTLKNATYISLKNRDKIILNDLSVLFNHHLDEYYVCIDGQEYKYKGKR